MGGVATAGVLAAALMGCNPEFEVTMGTMTFSYDFGASAGTVPTISCDPAAPALCPDAQAEVVSQTVRLGCDEATSLCFAEADIQVSSPFGLLQEDGIDGTLQRQVARFLHSIDLAYTVPVNTLTFDVPAMKVFVGPEGSVSATDPGVLPVDSVEATAAGQVSIEPRHLRLDEDSDAHAFVESSILDKRNFVFILSMSPRVTAGMALPGGAIQVDVSPTVRFGFPW